MTDEPDAGPLSPRREGRLRAVEGILRSSEAGGAARAGDEALRRLRAAAARPRVRYLPRRRPWAAAAAAFLLAAAGAAYLVLRAPPPDTAPRLIAATGDAEWVSPSGARPAGIGDALAPGWSLRLRNGSGNARLSGPDGTTLHLTGGAVLSAGAAPLEFHLPQGVLSADVRPQPPGRSFRITTPAARVEVLGTRFTLAAAGPAARVDVERGRLRLTRLADGRSVTVTDGLGAVVAPGRELAAGPAPAGWWDRGWPSRVRLTLAAPEGGEALRDFPLLVVLDRSRIDAANADGGRSLRFVAPDGRTVLPHEVESWDESGRSFVWVRVPELGPASPVEPLWMYWGGDPAPDGPGAADVWDGRFRMVYHLAETSGTLVKDSTARARHGMKVSAAAAAGGRIGGAQSFDGAKEGVDTHDAEDLAQWTVEAWVRGREAPKQGKAAGPIMRQNNYQMSWDHFTPSSIGAASLRIGGAWHAASFGDLGAETWHYLAGTFDGKTLKAFRDGRPAAAVPAPGLPDPSPETARIGRHAQYGDSCFGGLVDEVRVSDAARPEAWIAAQHRSMTDSLVAFGAGESMEERPPRRPPPAPPAAPQDAPARILSGAAGTFGPPNAFELPSGAKGQLQAALDAHRVVRLDRGSYRGGVPEVRLSSGQQLHGWPGANATQLPRVVVAPGTTDCILSGASPERLVFPAGAGVTRRCAFVGLNATSIEISGAALEENLFLNLDNVRISADLRAGGRLRDNRFIRAKSHASQKYDVEIRGDPGRRSGGNVFLWYNILTPHADSMYLENLEDFTLIGCDAEAWNERGRATHDMLATGPMGALRLFMMNGGQNVPPERKTGLYDVSADSFLYISGNLASGRNPEIRYRAPNKRSAVVCTLAANSEADEARDAVRLHAAAGRDRWKEVQVNGRSVFESPPTAAQLAGLRELFLPPAGAKAPAPWDRPAFGPIPDPAGPGWNAGLAAKPDSADSLQKQIDAQGVARLGPGVFYLSKPLRLKKGQGVVGAGPAKTALVARSPEIDLVVGDDRFNDQRSRSAKWTTLVLADLTLQGGRNGIHLEPEGAGVEAQYNNMILSHVTFRNMAEAGVFVDGICGVDNNLWYHVHFFRCGAGVKQRSTWEGSWPGEPGMSYLDKNVWFQCQFAENGIGADLIANRCNNNNAWINCLFRDNAAAAVKQRTNLNPLFANCDFIHNGGAPSITNDSYDPRIGLVGCRFQAGPAKSLIGGVPVAEGCVFERGASAAAQVLAGSEQGFFYNCTAKDLPLGPLKAGVLFNNRFAAEPALSEQGVLVRDGRPVTILPGASNPQPRLLAGR